MHTRDLFRLDDEGAARAIAAAHPFATIVAPDLRATHMPCLLDEDRDELAFLGHVARADPVAAALGGPLLLIFHGPHGYVSSSWYERDRVPTWNHVTLHVRGDAEPLDDPLPLLRDAVDRLEAPVARPWSLDRLGADAREMARGVVGFRLRARSWHAEAKLSQDKPAGERARVLAGLETPGPYAHAELAAAMRRFG